MKCKNYDVDFIPYYDFTYWSLPFSLSWYHDKVYHGFPERDDPETLKGWMFFFDIRFLCFGFKIEYWNWRKENA